MITLWAMILLKELCHLCRNKSRWRWRTRGPIHCRGFAVALDSQDVPFVDTILIYCYSGWRINELAKMPLENINLESWSFTGGLKNKYSKNRCVPIHSAIRDMVSKRYHPEFKSLIYHNGSKRISEKEYRESFNAALLACGITELHTPHDCRHTFNDLLRRAKQMIPAGIKWWGIMEMTLIKMCTRTSPLMIYARKLKNKSPHSMICGDISLLLVCY